MRFFNARSSLGAAGKLDENAAVLVGREATAASDAWAFVSKSVIGELVSVVGADLVRKWVCVT